MLSVFEFKGYDVRFVDGKPVANDVAEVLGYASPASTVSKKVKQKYKGIAKMETPGGVQDVTVLEEAGIYQLVLGSKLDSADEFQDWLFEEVLPSIRKTGSYSIKPITPAEGLLQMAQLMVEHERKLKELEETQMTQQLLLTEQQQQLDSVSTNLDTINNELVTLNMETQANIAELDRFRNGQGHWFSVLAYARLRGLDVSLNQSQSIGRRATAKCRKLNIVPELLSDPRYGYVNCYPEFVLEEVM